MKFWDELTSLASAQVPLCCSHLHYRRQETVTHLFLKGSKSLQYMQKD